MYSEFITGSEAFFDDDHELYGCHMGLQNDQKTLIATFFAPTEDIAIRLAKGYADVINNWANGENMALVKFCKSILRDKGNLLQFVHEVHSFAIRSKSPELIDLAHKVMLQMENKTMNEFEGEEILKRIPDE